MASYQEFFTHPYLLPWMFTSRGGEDSAAPGSGFKGFVAGGITGGIGGLYGLYLYKGLGVFGSASSSAVRFGTFEALKNSSVDEKGNVSSTARVFCGLGAGICEGFVIAPLQILNYEVTKRYSRRSSNKYTYKQRWVVSYNNVTSGVYRDFSASMLKHGGSQACRFFVLETGKDIYRDGDPTRPVPNIVVGAFGVLAGVASFFTNSPIEVVTAKMKMQPVYNGMLDCFMKTWETEGLAAFYHGTASRLPRVCLDVAFTFMLYDFFMEFLN